MTEKDQISRFLQGELSGIELVQFNLRMAKDEQFRKEVAAERLLHESILRDRLVFNAGRATNQKPSSWKKWLPMLTFLLVGGIGFAIYKNAMTLPLTKEGGTESTTTQPPLEKEDEIVPITEPSEPPPSEPAPAKKKEPTKTKQQSTKKAAPPDKKAPKRPPIYAANFTVNTLLEEAMTTTSLRGSNLQRELNQPLPAAKIPLENGIARLSFSGTATSDSDDNPVHLYFFSNKKEDYEQSRPIFENEVALVPSGDQFVFSLEKNIELQPGLYYYIFEDVNEEAYWEIGKLKIGN